MSDDAKLAKEKAAREKAEREERRDAYVNAGGARCPFCLSEMIVKAPAFSTPFDRDLRQNARCAACQTAWVDTYALVDMEPT